MLSGEEEDANMVDSCGKKDKFCAQGFALKCYLERKKMQIWLTVAERRISLVLMAWHAYCGLEVVADGQTVVEDMAGFLLAA